MNDGCPQKGRFPFLHVENLSLLEKQNLEIVLLKEWQDINFKFKELVNKTRIWLKTSGIHPCEVKASVLSDLYFGSFEQKFDDAKTYEAIFQLLWRSNSWSWFHFGVLEHLIGFYRIPTDDLKEYQDCFKRYCFKRIFECPSKYKGYSATDDTVLVLKFKSDLHSEMLLKLKEVENNIAKIINARKFLEAATVKEGCTEVFFTLPRPLAQEVFPLTPKQEEQLAECGVLQYYVYPDPGNSQCARAYVSLPVCLSVCLSVCVSSFSSALLLQCEYILALSGFVDFQTVIFTHHARPSERGGPQPPHFVGLRFFNHNFFCACTT